MNMAETEIKSAVFTLEVRELTGGRNLTEDVGEETQPCEDFEVILKISMEAVGDISVAEPFDPLDLPDPSLRLRERIREMRGDTLSGLDPFGGEGTWL